MVGALDVAGEGDEVECDGCVVVGVAVGGLDVGGEGVGTDGGYDGVPVLGLAVDGEAVVVVGASVDFRGTRSTTTVA
jgi:hypothetical protein